MTRVQTQAGIEEKVRDFCQNHPFIVLAIGAGAVALFSGVGLSTESAPKQSTCFSVWDGSATSLVTAVKRDLREPDSFQHIETRYNDTDPNILKVKMEYRAKNGFGGYNNEVAYGQLVKSTCVLFSHKG